MKLHLNDAIIKNIKPTDKIQPLKEGGGLFLYIEPNGSKRWRFRYRFNDKPCLLSLGLYPNVTLKKARTERLQELIKSGINPSVKHKAEKVTPNGDHPNCFEMVACEWHEQKRHMDKIHRSTHH